MIGKTNAVAGGGAETATITITTAGMKVFPDLYGSTIENGKVIAIRINSSGTYQLVKNSYIYVGSDVGSTSGAIAATVVYTGSVIFGSYLVSGDCSVHIRGNN